MREFRAPEVVIRRLAIYLRVLGQCEDEQEPYIASKELGDRAGVTSAQVRKDLAMFGEFGKQGVGYDVCNLKDEIRRILNVNRIINTAQIGVGELGLALARYSLRNAQRQPDYPFHLVAAFDIDPQKIGRKIERMVEIYPFEKITDLLRDLNVSVAVITVPASAAQDAVDRCVEGGVKGILNFAPAKVTVPKGVRLQSADVTLDLQQLAYYL